MIKDVKSVLSWINAKDWRTQNGCVDDNMLDKVLHKIKEIIGIDEFPDTEFDFIDTHD